MTQRSNSHNLNFLHHDEENESWILGRWQCDKNMPALALEHFNIAEPYNDLTFFHAAKRPLKRHSFGTVVHLASLTSH